MKIAICEDQIIQINLLNNKIKKWSDEKGVRVSIDNFKSAESFLFKWEDYDKYDIIFLDINMRELNGVETAKKIREYTQNVYIVFVTAFITYSLEGYKVDAVRYILKDNQLLEKAIIECLDTIINKMHYVENKYTFEFREGRKTLLIDDIVFIESNLHKLYFHLSKKPGQYTMYGRLDHIDELLKNSNFCRIHKSYLVNLKFVNKIERYVATLSDGTKVNISQPKYNAVREEFICFWGEI